MSSFPIKTKRRTINIKSLILHPCDDIKYKFKNLKISSLKTLYQTFDGEYNEKNEKFKLANTSRGQLKGMRGILKESSKKTLNRTKYYNKNNILFDDFLKNIKNLSSNKKGENERLNTAVNTYRGNNKINNLLLDCSNIKPKKQKFIQLRNQTITKNKLINNFIFNSNNIKKTIKKVNNNNNSAKTNKSNTLYDNDINNYTQRSTYIEHQKLNPPSTSRIRDNSLINAKNKNKKINIQHSRNIIGLLVYNTYKNNFINYNFKEKSNLLRTENKNNSKNHNNKLGKKKINHLLMKVKKKSNKTLPYREKILNGIFNNKIKLNPTLVKNIKIFKKPNKLNNTITITNKPKNIIIQEKKGKNIKKDIINLNKFKKINFAATNRNKEPKIFIANPKTKKIIFSPTPPKTKENTISIKDPIYKKVSKIDSCSLAGYTSSGVQKINQDNLFIKKNFLEENNTFFIGVCDGHGDYGHLISSYISQSLPNFLADISDKNIISSYNSLNENLVQNSKIDCYLSGSTCTSIILTPEKIISINLGDSRSVLAKCENGKYISINLTTDHKPNVPAEKKRILINGGRIKPFYDEKEKQFLGPDRVWIREDDIPGLAMTRSFGDIIAHSVGVISEPEIKRYDFSGNEKFIVIASDGIWEFISGEECVNIVKGFYENNLDAIGAINAIMKEAFIRWQKNEEIIDDITVIIIFFES